jgi:hypothetical protein
VYFRVEKHRIVYSMATEIPPFGRLESNSEAQRRGHCLTLQLHPPTRHVHGPPAPLRIPRCPSLRSDQGNE